jgi:hypothetical protein
MLSQRSNSLRSSANRPVAMRETSSSDSTSEASRSLLWAARRSLALTL